MSYNLEKMAETSKLKNKATRQVKKMNFQKTF